MSELSLQVGDVIQLRDSGNSNADMSRPPSLYLVLKVREGKPSTFRIVPKPEYAWSLQIDPSIHPNCGLSEIHIILPVTPITINPDWIEKVVGNVPLKLVEDSLAEYKLNI